jgi:hypothetical protein
MSAKKAKEIKVNELYVQILRNTAAYFEIQIVHSIDGSPSAGTKRKHDKIAQAIIANSEIECLEKPDKTELDNLIWAEEMAAKVQTNKIYCKGRMSDRLRNAGVEDHTARNSARSRIRLGDENQGLE